MSLMGLYFCMMGFLVTLILFLIILVLQLLRPLIGKIRASKISHNIASLWGYLIISFMPGWKVKVYGRENLTKLDGSALIVANHLSMTDIFVMFFLKHQFRFISKASVFKIPFIGGSMKCAGYVPLERGSKESHKKALAQCAQTLKSGISMLFFPEGTRSKDGKLKPFKVGAFKLAKENDCQVLPVALKQTDKMLPKGTLKPGKACVELHILAPVAMEADETLEEFAERARGHILTTLSKP